MDNDNSFFHPRHCEGKFSVNLVLEPWAMGQERKLALIWVDLGSTTCSVFGATLVFGWPSFGCQEGLSHFGLACRISSNSKSFCYAICSTCYSSHEYCEVCSDQAVDSEARNHLLSSSIHCNTYTKLIGEKATFVYTCWLWNTVIPAYSDLFYSHNWVTVIAFFGPEFSVYKSGTIWSVIVIKYRL